MSLYCPGHSGKDFDYELVHKQNYLIRHQVPKTCCEWKPKVIQAFKVGHFTVHQLTLLLLIKQYLGWQMTWTASMDSKHGHNLDRKIDIDFGCHYRLYVRYPKFSQDLCQLIRDMHLDSVTYQASVHDEVWFWKESVEFAFGDRLGMPAFRAYQPNPFWPFQYPGSDYFLHEETDSYQSAYSNNPFTIIIYHMDTVHLVNRFPIRKGFLGYMSPLAMSCWIYVALSAIFTTLLLHSSINQLPLGFIRTCGLDNALLSPIHHFLTGESLKVLEKSFTQLTSGKCYQLYNSVLASMCVTYCTVCFVH